MVKAIRLIAYVCLGMHISSLHCAASSNETENTNQRLRSLLAIKQSRAGDLCVGQRTLPCEEYLTAKECLRVSQRRDSFTDLAMINRFQNNSVSMRVTSDWAQELRPLPDYSYSPATKSNWPFARVLRPILDIRFNELDGDSIDCLRNNPPPAGYRIVINSDPVVWRDCEDDVEGDLSVEHCARKENARVMTQEQADEINAAWKEQFEQQQSPASRFIASLYRYRYIVPLLVVAYPAYLYAQKNMPSWIAQRSSDIAGLTQDLVLAKDCLAKINEVVSLASNTPKDVLLPISAQEVAAAFNQLVSTENRIIRLQSLLQNTAEWGVKDTVIQLAKDFSTKFALACFSAALIDRYLIQKCLAYKPLEPAQLVIQNDCHEPFCTWYNKLASQKSICCRILPCCSRSLRNVYDSFPQDIAEENQTFSHNRKIAAWLAGAAVIGGGIYVCRDNLKVLIDRYTAE